MRAVGYRQSLPIPEAEALIDLDLPRPVPTGRDLLVRIEAVSVNPVDTKVRGGAIPLGEGTRVLGWDAAGTVVEAGPEATRFAAGDAVFYAGDLTRSGTNAEFHLVDERIVGRKPDSLGFAEAAALPLTTITAWEALFDRLDLRRPVPGAAPAILIVGGLAVIATASRPETRAWALDLGAHHVVDHSRPLAAQVEALGLGAPGFVFATTNTLDHLPEIVTLIAPQGRLAVIDDPATLDVVPLKLKSVSLHWELMFTRSLFGTADMGEQGALLDEVSRLVDAGEIRTTLSEVLGPIDAATLKRAHALVEGGRTRGKVVLEGFPRG